MARRRCLGWSECKQWTTGVSWCTGHQRQRKARRNRDAQQAAAAVANHRAAFGDWCPGFERDAHPSVDLTADHPDGIAGGPNQELEVLCRSCNARKGQPNASAPQAITPTTIHRRQPRQTHRR